jgi:hypothetical protein
MTDSDLRKAVVLAILDCIASQPPGPDGKLSEATVTGVKRMRELINDLPALRKRLNLGSG